MTDQPQQADMGERIWRRLARFPGVTTPDLSQRIMRRAACLAVTRTAQLGVSSQQVLMRDLAYGIPQYMPVLPLSSAANWTSSKMTVRSTVVPRRPIVNPRSIQRGIDATTSAAVPVAVQASSSETGSEEDEQAFPEAGISQDGRDELSPAAASEGHESGQQPVPVVQLLKSLHSSSVFRSHEQPGALTRAGPRLSRRMVQSGPASAPRMPDQGSDRRDPTIPSGNQLSTQSASQSSEVQAPGRASSLALPAAAAVVQARRAASRPSTLPVQAGAVPVVANVQPRQIHASAAASFAPAAAPGVQRTAVEGAGSARGPGIQRAAAVEASSRPIQTQASRNHALFPSSAPDDSEPDDGQLDAKQLITNDAPVRRAIAQEGSFAQGSAASTVQRRSTAGVRRSPVLSTVVRSLAAAGHRPLLQARPWGTTVFRAAELSPGGTSSGAASSVMPAPLSMPVNGPSLTPLVEGGLASIGIQRQDEADMPAGDEGPPTDAAAPESASEDSAPAGEGEEPDMDEFIERALRMLLRRLAVEQERRGGQPWN